MKSMLYSLPGGKQNCVYFPDILAHASRLVNDNFSRVRRGQIFHASAGDGYWNRVSMCLSHSGGE